MVYSRGKILIIEHETRIRMLLEARFSAMGYLSITASDGQEGLSMYHQELPNVVVVDILIPKLDGFGVCQEIRKYSTVPIIVLTVLGDLGDKTTGFDLGIDDYLLKPFSFKELEARVRNILKRARKVFPKVGLVGSDVVSAGGIKIDTGRRQVYKQNRKVRLTGMEFNLLELLLSNSGKAFSRSSILKELWGYSPERDVDTRVVDVHISRLRSKLEHDPSNPDLILTARGTGYFFQGIPNFESYL